MSQQNGVDKVELTILVSDTKHLQKIINAIRTIDTVRLVSRHLESTPAMKPLTSKSTNSFLTVSTTKPEQLPGFCPVSEKAIAFLTYRFSTDRRSSGFLSDP